MSIVFPPITGDFQEDSWKKQVTDLINQGLAGFQGYSFDELEDRITNLGTFSNATLYVYQRTDSNTAPDGIGATTFNYETNTLTGTLNGWDRDAPDFDDGDYLWIQIVNIASESETESISADAWSGPTLYAFTGFNPDNVPIPSAPTDLTFTRINFDTGVLSWTLSEDDTVHPGVVSSVEIKDGDNYRVYSISAYPETSITITGNSLWDTDMVFRVKTINSLSQISDASSDFSVSPPTPLAVSGLVFERIDADSGEMEWTSSTDQDAFVKSFVIESRTSGTDTFRDFEVVDGNTRQHVLNGLGNESATFFFRVKAVSLAGISGPSSSEVMVGPAPVPAPTSLTATPIENVGVLTTVDLSWTLGSAEFVNYESVTIQFRPVTSPPSSWFDVATVSANEFEVDNLPPQQGLIEYRIRANAYNGQVSDFTESGAIFISGGSATDDAIYGGDGDFISYKHFSVNDDDFVFDTEAADLADITGGAYDETAKEINGDTDSELIVDFVFEVTQNMVDRSRHFYLDLGGTTSMGAVNNTDYWGVDRGTLFVEILADPATTEEMYHDADTDNDDDDLVYTTATGADNTNARSFDQRVDGAFMYATRAFIRLPIRRTFTFREAGTTRIRLRFTKLDGSYPSIPVDKANAPKLEAFSTELVETFLLENVTNTGTAITFTNDYEAAPCIFVTPGGNTSAYWTSKSVTGATIHTTSTEGVDVDVTVRGR